MRRLLYGMNLVSRAGRFYDKGGPDIALARGSVSVAVGGFPTVLPPIYLRPCPRRGLFLLAASVASARALYVLLLSCSLLSLLFPARAAFTASAAFLW